VGDGVGRLEYRILKFYRKLSKEKLRGVLSASKKPVPGRGERGETYKKRGMWKGTSGLAAQNNRQMKQKRN